MKSIVMLHQYSLLYDYIEEIKGFKKILVIEKEEEDEINRLLNVFDKVIQVDDLYSKVEMKEVIKSIKVDGFDIHALFSPHEGAMEIAGYLRDEFDIRGMSEKVATRVRDKSVMKRIARQHSIITNECREVDSLEAIKEFVTKYGYPIILKPLNGFGTINTFKINDERDLVYVIDVLANLDDNKLFKEFKDNYLVETFIEGNEYYCDSVVENGKIIASTISKYLYNCIETIDNNEPLGGIVYPRSRDEDPLVRRLKKMNEEVIAALEIDDSICHMEMFVNGEDIYFGEIAARIGGGTVIPPCVENTTNVNLIKAFLELNLHGVDQTMFKDKDVYTGFLAFPTMAGKVKKISSVSDYDSDEGVVQVKIYNKVDDNLGKQFCTASRTGFIIVEDSDEERLRSKLIENYNKFELEVEPL